MDKTVWRWFPHGLIGAMGVVFLVNGYMVYNALHTFPGQAGQDGFDLSNEYDRVLAATKAQVALGWQVETDVTPTHVPTLRLTDKAGAALAAASIGAQAERPVGPAETTALTFRPVGDGQYQADKVLLSGQWDILLTVRADGRLYTATRRVFIK